jgi:hypothetical protein
VTRRVARKAVLLVDLLDDKKVEWMVEQKVKRLVEEKVEKLVGLMVR